MGHHSITCCVSGLGISGGTPVRVILLSKNPYEDGKWDLRSPPIRAVYDDYGGIEDVHADDQPIVDLWLRTLAIDMVEKGTGDNTVHEGAVERGMPFEQLCETVGGRLEVRQDSKEFWRGPLRDDGIFAESRRKKEKFIPNLRTISALLAEAGLPITEGKNDNGGYIVDEPVPQLVRVRWGSYGVGHAEKLTKAFDIVRAAGFVVVIAKGSGRYPSEADLLVFTAPDAPYDVASHGGPQWDMAAGKEADDDRILRIDWAMVREDVWQAVSRFPKSNSVSLDCLACGQQSFYHKKDLRCPTESINKKPYKKHKSNAKYTHGPVFPDGVDHVVVPREYGETVWYGLDAYRNGVKHVIEAANEMPILRRVIGEAPRFTDFNMSMLIDNQPGAWILKDPTPGVLGIGAHIGVLLAAGLPVPDALVDGLAELAAVTEHMRAARIIWHPTCHAGPQDPERASEVRHLRVMLKLAEAEVVHDAKNDRVDETPDLPWNLKEAQALLAQRGEVFDAIEERAEAPKKRTRLMKTPAKTKSKRRKS